MLRQRARSDLLRAPDGSEMFLLFQDLTQPDVDVAKWSVRFTTRMRRVRATFRVLNVLWALGEIALLAFYVYSITSRYLGQEPGSTVRFHNPDNATFPMVTVCPYSGVGAISVLRCVQYFGEDTVAVPPQPRTMLPVTIGSATCFQFNADPASLAHANGTGFFHSVDMYFRANASSDAFLNALSVDLSDTGVVVDAARMASATTFAAVGQSTVVSLEKLLRVNATGIETPSWSSSGSSMPNSRTVTAEAGANVSRDELVFLSLSYRQLSVEVVSEQFTYQLTSLFGDFAGMTGILTGLHLSTFILGVEKQLIRCCVLWYKKHQRSKEARGIISPGVLPDGAMVALRSDSFTSRMSSDSISTGSPHVLYPAATLSSAYVAPAVPAVVPGPVATSHNPLFGSGDVGAPLAGSAPRP